MSSVVAPVPTIQHIHQESSFDAPLGMEEALEETTILESLWNSPREVGKWPAVSVYGELERQERERFVPSQGNPLLSCLEWKDDQCPHANDESIPSTSTSLSTSPTMSTPFDETYLFTTETHQTSSPLSLLPDSGFTKDKDNSVAAKIDLLLSWVQEIEFTDKPKPSIRPETKKIRFRKSKRQVRQSQAVDIAFFSRLPLPLLPQTAKKKQC